MPSKSMLVVLGFCTGLVFFGINIAVINFNCLVAPEQPLALLDWRRVGDEMEITLLGETLHLSLDNPWPGDILPNRVWPDSAEREKIIEQAGELCRDGLDEVSRRLVPVQHKVREVIGWP
ncbi:hypothetical protein [Desulfallas thermosapovorans]|nr:hypothetical protein [Desulfallas thermosapovorans]